MKAMLLNKTIKLHVFGTKEQNNFIDKFDPAKHLKWMIKTLKRPQKKKEEIEFTPKVEQYHFYFVNMMLNHLIKDQQKEKDPKL